LSTHLSFPEIAAEMFLSRTTMKSEALSIYRKLGASSRSPAVARSHELRLDELGRALLRLNLSIDGMLRRMTFYRGLARHEYDVALARHSVGALDGPQSGGHPRFAGGDGLAVLSAIGALGQPAPGPGPGPGAGRGPDLRRERGTSPS
jgi:hypothetical protein